MFASIGMNKHDAIYVCGRDTLVGSALVRRLRDGGHENLVGITAPEVDFAHSAEVDVAFRQAHPAYVYVAAGQSGGIQANQRFPADLMLDNLRVTCNILETAYRHGVKKLLYLASSCSYPRDCPQPMRVDALLTGPLEPTNEAYAIAKLAGIKLCQAYRQQFEVEFLSAIPANPFGPGDDFDVDKAHVIPALMARMHAAKIQHAPCVSIWGTGNPRRDFIFADDLADACIFIMNRYGGPEPINVGGGMDLSIREVAEAVREVVGYSGTLQFDATRPDGMPIKVLDGSALQELGWQSATPFRTALTATYRSFLATNQGDQAKRAPAPV